MKLSKEGFMMAEVIVVSAIILAFLAGIFISYNKLYAAYTTRLTYYDTTALYRIGYYHDYLVKNNSLNNLKNTANTSNYALVTTLASNKTEKVYLIKPGVNLAELTVSETEIHVTFQEYINYLGKSVTFNGKDYIMVIERCANNNEDDCKYAYLEVTDET